MNTYPTELHDVIAGARAAHGRLRVIAVRWNDEKCWMKQTGGSNDMSAVNKIHRFFNPILPPILRSVQIEDQLISLKSEIKRLREWEVLNLPSPRVLAEGEDWYLTNDGGTTLIAKLSKGDFAASPAYLIPALEALLTVHRAGTAHGRPMIKDMAADDHMQITLLDLEENTVPVMPLASAQARDLWIFLASITRYVDRATLDQLVTRALSQSTAATLVEMRKSLKLLLALKKLLGWLGSKRLGREITGAFELADSLEIALKRL